MPTNLFESAFSSLLGVQEAVFGTRKKAKINGTDYDAVIGELDFDTILVAGGIAENGGFEVQVKASDIGSQPAQFSPIIVEGRTLKILSVKNANGIYTLTAADPAAET